ncbi:hypothetical protein TsocGM_04335 [Tautonia sociabilis]|uniref:Uncharacterized protein n=1 Tax=Tautonia sociabilis TaxID=2080755 RepID=A0A432MPJ4_9BACT|nr:hypothetical protein TsocGM_04335 [Tautonia sociabilis]
MTPPDHLVRGPGPCRGRGFGPWSRGSRGVGGRRPFHSTDRSTDRAGEIRRLPFSFCLPAFCLLPSSFCLPAFCLLPSSFFPLPPLG